MKVKSWKICRIIFALLFIFTAFFAAFSILSNKDNSKVNAASDVNYKKKVVSVLFDNSGSMADDNKREMAKYSLQILVNLLDKDDILWICPMNRRTSADDPFELFLGRDDIAQQIQDKIINQDALKIGGQTPSVSIKNTINVLENKVDERYRLKKSNDLNVNDADNVEHWLVMLTDGAFSQDLTNKDISGSPQEINNIIESCIKDYSSLKTLYLCFGKSGTVDLTGEDLSLNKGYPFSAYFISDKTGDIKENLIFAMQDVANKISGRYDAERSKFDQSDAVSVSGDQVTINLNKLGFAVNDIAILVQDSNAELIKEELPDGVKIERQGSLDGLGIIKNGNATVIRDAAGGLIAERTLVFKYNSSLGNSVSVFVKPAITVNAFIEREKNGVWERVDFGVINSEMKPKDKIRVNYEVRSSSDDKLIDLEEIFGEPTEKITYGGQNYRKGDPIELIKGNNAIDVSVSVLNGSYTMYSNIMCYIERDPTAYRIESVVTPKTGVNNKKVDLSYTIFRNDEKVSDADIGNYSFEVKAVYPDGTEKVLRSDAVLNNNDIKLLFDGSSLDFGAYRVKATVTEIETKLKRVKEDVCNLLPENVTVNCNETEKFSKSAYLVKKGGKDIAFSLEVDGIRYPFDHEYVAYKAFVGSVNVTDKIRVENGDIIYTIDADVPDLSVGNKTLKVETTFFGAKTASAEYVFEILPSVYEARALPMGERELDLYKLRSTNAAVYFEIIKDGVILPAEEITEAMENGEISIDKNPGGWITLLPCKVDVSVETENGQSFIALRVGDDMGAPWDNLFTSFIFAGEKQIKLSYNNANASDTIEIKTLSFVGRLWRWLVILAIILFILHVVLYLFGFVIARPLPKGTLLCFDIGTSMRGPLDGALRKKVNMKKREIVMWHLSRFIPFKVFQDQKPVRFFAVTLSVEKKSKNPIFTANRNLASLMFSFPMSNEGNAINAMIGAYARNRTPDFNGITKSGFMNSSRRNDNTVIARGKSVSAYGWYGTPEEVRVGRPEVITQVFTFIQYRKR